MKKLLALLLAGLMLLSLCACAGGNAQKEASPADGSNTTAQEDPAVPSAEERDPDYEAAQEFAGLYLTQCAHVFTNPLSVEVLKAWYWKNSIDQYFFTFQLNVKNGAGIVETVYYGTRLIGFDELTEQAAKDARYMTVNGVGHYFEEDAIDAMQKGTELDAVEIQDYFLKNYK